MKQFMDADFLLQNETAKVLYHEHAEKMPIYDYHCHLPIQDIYNDRKFESITKMWIVDGHYGDHYKWRAIRANGVGEKFITGDASDKEKFMKWAETIPYTVGNPLYHWTHLELKRFFGFEKIFSPATAEEAWTVMNKKLETMTARECIKSANVHTLCTTDDPIDDLHFHDLLAQDKSFKTRVFPAWRPDKVVNIDYAGFQDYIKKLGEVVGYEIKTIEDLEKAITERINFFHEHGCRVADHGLDYVVYQDATHEELAKIFAKGLNNEPLTDDEVAKYRGYIIVFCGRQYHDLGWVQQYHVKALRNNSTKMFKELGPDTGFDAIADGTCGKAISSMMGALDRTGQLPKTILYSLNPSDMEMLATLAMCFPEEGIKQKVQLGSGWWFLDQKDGMEKQLTALSHLGLLSKFIGMLTDSRSFLSYTRHEYFRRILCNKLGELVENGEYPNDIEFLGKVVEDICFNNAVAYFDSSR